MAAHQLATRTARAPPEPEFVLRGHGASSRIARRHRLALPRRAKTGLGRRGRALLAVEPRDAAPRPKLGRGAARRPRAPRARRRPANADARNPALGPGEFSRAATTLSTNSFFFALRELREAVGHSREDYAPAPRPSPSSCSAATRTPSPRCASSMSKDWSRATWAGIACSGTSRRGAPSTTGPRRRSASSIPRARRRAY